MDFFSLMIIVLLIYITFKLFPLILVFFVLFKMYPPFFNEMLCNISNSIITSSLTTKVMSMNGGRNKSHEGRN